MVNVVSCIVYTEFEHYTIQNAAYEAYGQVIVAQTFNSSSNHNLYFVKLMLSRIGYAGSVKVSIRQTSGGKPESYDLAYGTILFSSIIESEVTGQVYTIYLNSSVTIQANQLYAIVIQAPSGGLSNYVNVWFSSAGSYAKGTKCNSSDLGGSWTVQTSRDLFFGEWGNPYTPSTPLPWGLDIGLLLGTILLAILFGYIGYEIGKPFDHEQAAMIIGGMCGLYISAFYGLLPTPIFILICVVFSGLFYVWWRRS